MSTAGRNSNGMKMGEMEGLFGGPEIKRRKRYEEKDNCSIVSMHDGDRNPCRVQQRTEEPGRLRYNGYWDNGGRDNGSCTDRTVKYLTTIWRGYWYIKQPYLHVKCKFGCDQPNNTSAVSSVSDRGRKIIWVYSGVGRKWTRAGRCGWKNLAD